LNSEYKVHTLVIDEELRRMFIPISDNKRDQLLNNTTAPPPIKVWMY